MTEQTFAGKSAIVTGGGSGIGAATVELLLAGGAHVLAVDRNSGGLETLAASADTDRLKTMTADVSVEADVEAFVACAVESFGHLDILVNNAGIEIGIKPLVDIVLQDAERVLRVNILGPFLGMKHAIPVMAANGGGSIVNVGSVSGMVGTPTQAIYSASKAGVINMTRAAAAENGGKNIRINCVAPGPIATPLFDSVAASVGMVEVDIAEASGGRLAIPRIGRPNEVAEVIGFLSSDRASYVTGALYSVDGGFTAV